MTSFSSLPSQGVPLVKDGNLALEWYRYLVEAYQYSGLAKAQFPLWEDCACPALSMKPDSVAPGLETFQGNLKAYAFDATTAEALLFTLQLPHGYTEGQDVVPYVQWAPSTIASGNVVWTFEYSWANIDATMPNSTTQTIVDSAGGVARKHRFAAFSPLVGSTSGVNQKASSLLHCRISRSASSVSDTYVDDAFLLCAGVHYQRSAHGTPKVLP